MSGASIEATLELWASSLRDVQARIQPLFTQERVAASAGAFLDGLLGDERRETRWMRAEAAGDPGPWRQQAILGRGRRQADSLRDLVGDYVGEDLAADDAVLAIDETGFLKQAHASCGVGRQYTGSAGKITNCQIGVFASYVSRHGHAFIDRALYLPKAWTDDPARMKSAHVPDTTNFATKPALAIEMVARAIAAAVQLHDWVYCELADLELADYAPARSGMWTRGLLIRRKIVDGELAFFSTWCPAGTGIEQLVLVEGQRWAIEDSFETAKNELGLDHNETRSWHGWHRHVSLVMLAFAMMASIRTAQPGRANSGGSLHRSNALLTPSQMELQP